MQNLRRTLPIATGAWLLVLLGGLPGCGGGCGGETTNGDWAFVTLEADQRASVTLDGALIGNTPLRKYAVTPGEHTVVLECVACPMPQKDTLTFVVEPGELHTHAATTFLGGAGDVSTGTTTETVADTTDWEVAGTGTAEGKSFLTVNSKPWSVVFLDGALMGNTPFKDKPIDSGYHTMVVKCGPCEAHDELERTFFVEEGQTHVSVANDFGVEGSVDPLGTNIPGDDDTEGEPKGQGFLQINSTPWATVSVDGIEVGKTPIASHTVEAGSHKALLECGGCSEPMNELFLFSVAPGETYTIQGKFED